MLFALDTEFMDDGITITLLSIGLVGEDGSTFYREVIDADYTRANPFVRDHVLPVLGACPGGLGRARHWSLGGPCSVDECPWILRENLGQAIRRFTGERPDFVGYYVAYDWVALCQCFGAMIHLPPGWPMYATDLRAWLDNCGLHALVQPEDMPHQALSDARWIMQTWQECHGETRLWHGYHGEAP